ncbi:hypothetical protein LCGC14_1403830 [marine sediment metagenome]|uniref:Uncharacterized protein n=1 Tax=marine sediment metagenome TaxID=412755 RepID=A0A0F9JWI7_9ZZZZ
MVLARGRRINRERQAVYFDLIFGAISSIISLSAIIYVTILNRITVNGWAIAGFTFWLAYFLVSVLMISYGIYTHFKEKVFDETKYKKDIRAPIV